MEQCKIKRWILVSKNHALQHIPFIMFLIIDEPDKVSFGFTRNYYR